MIQYVMFFVSSIITLLLTYKLYKYNNKINVFTYWIGDRPEYISLCLHIMNETLKDNCNFYILNDKSVAKMLPDLDFNKLNKLEIPQKSDIIRVNLLYKYGGVWIDADTILFKDITPLFDLDKNDFVGSGNSYVNSNYGYPRPSNGVMGSRKNGVLISEIKKRLDEKLDAREDAQQDGYFSYGREVIWGCIEDLQERTSYKYKHLCSSIDGTRDSSLNWVHTDNHLSKDFKISDLYNHNNLHFAMLANRTLSKTYVRDWTVEQLLSSDIFLSSLFRKSVKQLKN